MHRKGNGGAHFTAMAGICEETTFPNPNEGGQIKDPKPTDTALPSPVVTLQRLHPKTEVGKRTRETSVKAEKGLPLKPR